MFLKAVEYTIPYFPLYCKWFLMILENNFQKQGVMLTELCEQSTFYVN